VASKRRLRRNHCGDKQQYETREAAHMAAVMLRHHKGDKKDKLLNVYQCLWASHYHIGHKPKQSYDSKVSKAHKAQREATHKKLVKEREEASAALRESEVEPQALTPVGAPVASEAVLEPMESVPEVIETQPVIVAEKQVATPSKTAKKAKARYGTGAYSDRSREIDRQLAALRRSNPKAFRY